MALTLTDVRRNVPGDQKQVVVDILFDNSYPIGGEAVTAATFGLGRLDHIFNFVARNPQAVDLALVGVFDAAASKLVLFWGDSDGVADGALVEVPNTTDLSAYTARVVALGV